MTIYISNVNGDWWEYENSPLFILDTQKLTPEEISEIEDEGGFEGDKFEYIIQDYGTELSLKELI